MLKSHEKFHSSNGKRLVLVAEDEEINRELLGFVLCEDYEVIFASDGLEALRLIREYQNRLSIVLLDLIMPGMGGLELLEKLKEDTALQMIPVIVLTADQESEIKALTLGAADFIPKPYPQSGVILARIRRTIELFEDRLTIQTTERDPLTNLYNREYFFHYAELFDQYHESLDMDAIVIDIYHFRIINERFGNAYGDEVLKRIGLKVREMVSDTGGIVCRKEADTFLIYCPHGKDYQKILESASEGLSGENVPLNRVRLRMGVYQKVDRSIPIERRFDRAKIAADMIRNSFSKSIEIYDHELHEREIYQQQLLEDFPQGLSENQFRVYYQPKYDIRPKKPVLVSAEALVRWVHPKFGFIPPDIFIPLIEENGLIEELDVYVWNKVAEQIWDWKKRLGFVIPVSVNVSRVDMYDPGLVDNLRGILVKHNIEAEDLFLEVTESAYTKDSDQIISTVKVLRKWGFRIEMDDFGNGYSSLNMLSTLPIDALKLDMEFVRNAFRKQKDTKMLEIIIDIADYLGVPVVAEGVETDEQIEALQAIGCDIAQGFYFSRPLPVEEFEEILKKEKAKNRGDQGQQDLQNDPVNIGSLTHALPADTENIDYLDNVTFAGIAKALAQDYFAIYIVDTVTDHYYEYKSDKSYKRLGIAGHGDDFFEQSRKNSAGIIYSEDRIRFLNNFTKENILKNLSANGVFMMTYRLLIDGVPTFVSMKISSLGESEKKIVVGVNNISSGMEDRDKALAYAGISKALVGSYLNVYYIDMDTEKYIDLAFDGEKGMPDMEKTGTDFFSVYENRVINQIHPEDRGLFRQQFNKEYILGTTEAGKTFKLSYRMWLNGKWTYLHCKIIRTDGQSGNNCVMSVSNMDEQMRLEAEHLEAIRQMNRDALTGVRSRHSYLEDEKEINGEISAGMSGTFGLLFCDLNGLKHINDTYGHAEGDEFIKEACRTICHIFKRSPVYRVGGDEFIVLLRGEDFENREYLYKMVTSLNYAQEVGRKVVIACGMAEYQPGTDSAVSDLYKRADAAMYENKKQLKLDLGM